MHAVSKIFGGRTHPIVRLVTISIENVYEQGLTTLLGILLGGLLTFTGGLVASRLETRRRARLETLERVGRLKTILDELILAPPARASGELLNKEADELIRAAVVAGIKEYRLASQFRDDAWALDLWFRYPSVMPPDGMGQRIEVFDKAKIREGLRVAYTSLSKLDERLQVRLAGLRFALIKATWNPRRRLRRWLRR